MRSTNRTRRGARVPTGSVDVAPAHRQRGNWASFANCKDTVALISGVQDDAIPRREGMLREGSWPSLASKRIALALVQMGCRKI